MWVAKCSLNGEIVSKKFKSIYDCQKYINENCKVLEYLCSSTQAEIDRLNNQFVLRFGSYIRCWNTTDNRWCDGMDF